MKRWLTLGIALGGLVAVTAGAVSWWLATPTTRLVVVQDPLSATRPDPRPGAPDVIVVIGCTLRRDQLGVYDRSLATTPYLNQLAASGAVFDDVITAAPWTRPAAVALLTGRHAVTIGMVEPGDGMDRRLLAPEVVTLAEQLRDGGWTTIGGTANPNVSTAWNLAQGFDRYVQPEGTWAEGQSGKIPAQRLIDRVLEEVDARPDGRPLYLQVVLIETHAPIPDALPTPQPDPVPADVLAYRAAVHRFDDAVRDLHAALAERGVGGRDALLVVVNDHGEGLDWPEHHGMSHGRYLAPSAVGGVWVVAGPGVPVGARVAGVVSQVDVFPTLAELAGVPVAGGIAGISQVPAFATGWSVRDVAYSDTWFLATNRSAIYTDDAACQRDWSAAPEREGPARFRSGCFDRRADPTHANPRADEGLEERLVAWRREAEAEGARFTGAGYADPDEETLQALEALGYRE